MADLPIMGVMGDQAGYNPDCDTCTYAWCCGRCYCCHPSPLFEIRKVEPAPEPVDDRPPVMLEGGLWVPAGVADVIEADRG